MVGFRFFKLINPTWYFNLKPKVDHGYFPTVAQLELAGVKTQIDTEYVSEVGMHYDASWNAFQAGFINTGSIPDKSQWDLAKLPIQDEYRFLRKNFSPLWSMYVLVLRLLSFNNPITEIRGWWKVRKVKRLNHSEKPFLHSDFADYKSQLLQEQPLISVIIPTLNRYSYLKDVLKDLEAQTYQNFEVIIVDQSEPFQSNFYAGWKFKLTYWYQAEKALWKARNDAIEKARGEYILLYDDDSRVDPDWIEQHIKTLDFFKADISSGVSISTIGASVPPHYSYFRWSDQLDTGNVLIRRNVFEKIGLFDRQFEKQRMGDGEFGLRAYLFGFRNISNPYAKRIHLKVAIGGLRQMGSWDGWRPKSLFSPRPVPSVLYFYRKYYGNSASRLSMIKSIFPSLVPYRFKGSKGYLLLILVIFPLVLPFLIIQMCRSWILASQKLKKGPIIQSLEPTKK